MKTHSAGIVLYRRRGGAIEVFLGRFGGPYWRNQERAWGIPKGEYDPEREAPEDAARREFAEETGLPAPAGLTRLGRFAIGRSKVLEAYLAEGDLDADAISSNTFELEWPPNSGRTERFPEIERGAWFPLSTALGRVTKSQVPIVEALVELLGDAPSREPRSPDAPP